MREVSQTADYSIFATHYFQHSGIERPTPAPPPPLLPPPLSTSVAVCSPVHTCVSACMSSANQCLMKTGKRCIGHCPDTVVVHALSLPRWPLGGGGNSVLVDSPRVPRLRIPLPPSRREYPPMMTRCEDDRFEQAANIESLAVWGTSRIKTAYYWGKLISSIDRKCLKLLTIQYLRAGVAV